MAHVILYRTKKTTKQPIMSFASCFLAIRWSIVSVFKRLALPPARIQSSSPTALVIAFVPSSLFFIRSGSGAD